MSWFKRDGTWQAQIYVAGRSQFLGRFDRKDAAAAAYCAAARAAWGDFARFE